LIIICLPLDADLAGRLAERGPNIVTIETSQRVFSSVEIDDFAGGRLAAQYLAGKGHQRCAFIGDIDPPDYAIRPVVSRLTGFRRGLEEAGLALPEDYIHSSRYDQEPTRQAVRELLCSSQPPTAIFAAADIQAIGVLKVARELGLNVPRDLAIIGFDDLDLADYVGLTTVRQPLDDSGRIAAELLLSGLTDTSWPVQHIELPLSIVERETV
jgi:DNA-binding LacI/PurR family transcriptional regulator